ncbi:MAG: hypothetical protein ACRCYR_04350 [Phycicoccus sp.]
MSAAALLAHADALVCGPPLLQVAVDGWWERARQVRLPTTTAVDPEAAADLAVELLWWGPPVVFVGARFANEPAPVERLARSAAWTPSTAVEVLSESALGAVTHAELGRVNAWRSTGPLPLAVHADERQIRDALDTRPDLRVGPGAIAVEMVVDATRRWWCGVETGTDAERIAHLLTVARRPVVTRPAPGAPGLGR